MLISMLPRDEADDAKEIQQWHKIRQMAYDQAILAHERGVEARRDGDRMEAGANAEIAWEWAALWRDMTEEQQEAEMIAEEQARVQAARVKREAKQQARRHVVKGQE